MCGQVSQMVSRELERESVVVFDEAHNIDNVCIEALSINLRQATLEGAQRNITRLQHAVERTKATDADRLRNVPRPPLPPLLTPDPFLSHLPSPTLPDLHRLYLPLFHCLLSCGRLQEYRRLVSGLVQQGALQQSAGDEVLSNPALPEVRQRTALATRGGGRGVALRWGLHGRTTIGIMARRTQMR